MVEVDNSGMLQALGLVEYGFDHIWMAVPAADGRNSSECVQVAASILIEQILLLAINHMQLQRTKASKHEFQRQECLSFNQIKEHLDMEFTGACEAAPD